MADRLSVRLSNLRRDMVNDYLITQPQQSKFIDLTREVKELEELSAVLKERIDMRKTAVVIDGDYKLTIDYDEYRVTPNRITFFLGDEVIARANSDKTVIFRTAMSNDVIIRNIKD